MGLKRRSATRVVPVRVKLGKVPATALRNLPLTGTIQDVLDHLFTQIVKDSIRTDEKRRTR